MRLRIIENPLKFERFGWKRAAICFASFSLVAVFHFRDGLPKMAFGVLTGVLCAVVLALSYLLWRKNAAAEPDPQNTSPSSDRP
jgi:drug/metabolite transporter (DMT)-like permease